MSRPRSAVIVVGALVLVVGMAVLVPRGTKERGALTPQSRQEYAAASSTAGFGKVTPEMRAEIDRVVAQGRVLGRQLRALRGTPVHVLGAGTGHNIANWHRGVPFEHHDHVAPAKARAFAQAGMTLADIDMAQLYDPFTISPLMQLEAYGFVKEGQGGPFYAEGGAARDGTASGLDRDGTTISRPCLSSASPAITTTLWSSSPSCTSSPHTTPKPATRRLSIHCLRLK